MPAKKKANNAAGANAAAAVHLPERLRDPAVFLAELACRFAGSRTLAPALCTNVEGLAVVIAGARHHCADPRVQAAVLVALKKLISGVGDSVKVNGKTADSNIGTLFELGALEAALAAMSAHAAERAVQAAACGMLARLGAFSPHATAIRAKFAELGAVARIMGALDAFPRDRELVKDAVGVLGSLMNGNTAGTAQIIALGGIERVLMAMDNHPDSFVCVHAVCFLSRMSLTSPEATQRLAALGAEARVRGAMAAPDAHALTTEYGQELLDRLLAVDFATYIFTQWVSIYTYT
jgi:hypothetical protein